MKINLNPEMNSKIADIMRLSKQPAQMYGAALIDAYRASGLEPDEIPHWIPVSKRLPDPGERVLMCVGDTVFEGHVNQRGEWDRYDNIMGTVEELFGAPVTYWQPLPAAPKEEK